MVDFRYHLVSIVAVFLALALGVVVGTTALNGVALDRLESSNASLIDDKRTLEERVGELGDQADADAEVFARLGPDGLTGRLAGERVVLLRAPESDDDAAEELTRVIESAGAQVTAEVGLRPDLLEPPDPALLDDLVADVAPPGALEVPDGGGALERASAALSAALLQAPDGRELSLDDSGEILGAFTAADLVDLEGPPEASATLAVLLVGTGGEDVAPGSARATALLSVARAVDAAGGGLVVAGPADELDVEGPLTALREAELIDDVSSVDGVDRPVGRAVVVLALVEQRSGDAGRYGTGPQADTAAPELPAR